MIDTIIIGAGTAGLTAAIYSLRAGLSVTIIENEIYGGQIINTPKIDNFPGLPGVSGAEFAASLYQQATSLGATVEFGRIAAVELTGETKKVYLNQEILESRSVIIATGKIPRKQGCPGEDAFAGKGVSYCATCDGAFHRGKAVAVIGGGNTAIEEALVLSDLCQTVYLIHRRDEFTAELHNLEQLKQRGNVLWLTDSEAEEITGDNIVSAIRIKHLADNREETIPVSGVFVAIGSAPDSRLLESQIDMDLQGYIIADENCQTNIAGVFVAGDARTKKVRQLVTAAADGAVAALAAKEYIRAVARSS